MGEFKDTITAYVNKNHDNWDEFLSLIAFQYRTTVCSVTKFTPFFLVYGREAQSSPDEEKAKLTDRPPLCDYIAGLQQNLQYFWGLAAERINGQTETYNRVPSVPQEFVPYEVNEWVMIRREPKRLYRNKTEKKQFHLSSKIQHRFNGPYLITAKLSDLRYLISCHGTTRETHALHMKPHSIAKRLSILGKTKSNKKSPMPSIPEEDGASEDSGGIDPAFFKNTPIDTSPLD